MTERSGLVVTTEMSFTVETPTRVTVIEFVAKSVGSPGMPAADIAFLTMLGVVMTPCSHWVAASAWTLVLASPPDIWMRAAAAYRVG